VIDMQRPTHLRALALLILLYVVLAGAMSYVRAPYCDEAYLASPAYNLIHHGYMGTSILDETSTWHKGMSLRGINRYTYQVMPLHFLTQAAWYEVTGFGLFRMRALSIAWGVLALVSLYLMVSRLFGDARPALWAVALVAIDGIFLDAASYGRPDMAAAALGFAGLGAYMALQEKRLTLAVLAANFFVACAVFTHPAAMPAFGCVIFLGIFYSLRRIRIWHLPLAALPYVAIAGAWGLYIARAPDIFREQFGSNASGRFSGLAKPWTLIAHELTTRYLPAFGFGVNVSTGGRVKVILLLAYAVAIAACLLTPALRKQKAVQALLVVAGLYLAIMTVLEGTKQMFYLVEVVPIYTAILGVWLWWGWTQRSIPRAAVAAALVGLVGIQMARFYHVCSMDTLHRQFVPAARFVERDLKSSSSIMGTATLAFALGFDDQRLVDDLRLGYFTHKTPDAIVIDDRYNEWFGIERTEEPAVAQYMNELLRAQYRPVYDYSAYRIYVRK
jgi:4-amino-4-deoxy-L-arabinose transferase-like glycosyltransferase